jgi:hypothetical protein
VIVPGFGGFMAHHVDARYDGRDSMFLPPLRTIGFNPQLQMNDSLLALSYVEAYDISYPEALNRIADEVTEMRQTLENSGKFELNDIGTIILNEDGNYTFEPCEAGILTPELYGLGGLNMLPLAQISAEEVQKTEDSAASIIEMPAKTVENNRTESEVKNQDSNQKMESGLSVNNSVFVNEEEESNAEFISIKKSWLRNIAAACIALIAFFTYSSPLGTPTVQKSQIDTGMLNRIMPKEINKVAQPQELVLSTDKFKDFAYAMKVERTPDMFLLFREYENDPKPKIVRIATGFHGLLDLVEAVVYGLKTIGKIKNEEVK